MEYFRKSGKTVLFVSHDPQLVQRFCSRALWLEGGRVAMEGNAREVVTAYQAFCAKLEDELLRDAARNGGIRSREHDGILRELQLTGSRWGNGKIRFTDIEMINSRGEATWVFKSGEAVTIRLRYESERVYERPVFAVDIHRFDGIFIGSINNYDTHPSALPVRGGAGTIELHIPRLELPYSVYFLSLKAYTESGEPDWSDPADIHNQIYQFDVVTEKLIHGLIKFDAEWTGAGENAEAKEITVRERS
jgi:hypothetical protein